jgi:hypothetical protein
MEGGKEGKYGWMYFTYLYENRTMKSPKLFLKGRMVEGVNLIKVHCKHLYKCHNETPMYNSYMLTKSKSKRKSIINYFL